MLIFEIAWLFMQFLAKFLEINTKKSLTLFKFNLNAESNFLKGKLIIKKIPKKTKVPQILSYIQSKSRVIDIIRQNSH